MKLKTIITILIILIIIILASFAFLPSVLSTEWGKNILLGQINNRISGKVEIKKIDLSWFGKQTFENLILHDENNNQILSLEQLSVDDPLWKLTFNRNALPSFDVSHLNAHLVPYENATNIQYALQPSQKKRDVSAITAPIIFENVNAHVQTKPGTDIQALLNGYCSQEQLKGQFDIDFRTPETDPNKLVDAITHNKFTIKANLKDIPVDVLDNLFLSKYPSYKGLLTSVLGKSLNLSISQSQVEDQNIAFVQLMTPHLNGELTGQFQNGRFALTKSSLLTLTLAPDSIQAFSPSWITLNKGNANLTINQLSFEYPSINPQSFIVNANVEFPSFILKNPANSSQLLVNYLQAKLEAPIKSNDVILKIDGQGTQNNQPLSLKLDWTVQKSDKWTSIIDAFKHKSNFDVEGVSLPIPLIDNLLNLQQRLLGLIGPTANLKIKGQMEPNGVNLALTASSDKLNLEQTTLHFDHNDSPFVGQMQAQKINLHGLQLDQVVAKWNINTDLKQGEASIETKNDMLKGHLTAKNWENQDFQGDLSIKDMPTSTLQLLGNVKDDLHTLLGERFSLAAKTTSTSKQSDWTFDLKGDNAKVMTSAVIQNNELILNEPLLAEISLHPRYEKIINKYFPLFKGLVSSEGPIKVRIEPEGFFMGLTSDYLTSLNIPKGVIEMKQIWFSQDSNLASVASLLKIDYDENLSVKMTPLYFNFQVGDLGIKRVDLLLLENYPLAAWGDVNIVKDKVDMTVGLTSRTLSNAFGVHKLPADRLLQLPFTGTLAKAKIDRHKATARIAALIAELQGKKANSFFGTIVEIAAGGISDPSPPPTTEPLPWSIAAAPAKDATDTAKNAEEETTDPTSQALKELENKATKALKKIFK